MCGETGAEKSKAHVNVSWWISVLVLAPSVCICSHWSFQAYLVIRILPEGEEPVDFLEVAEECGPSCYP